MEDPALEQGKKKDSPQKLDRRDTNELKIGMEEKKNNNKSKNKEKD